MKLRKTHCSTLVISVDLHGTYWGYKGEGGRGRHSETDLILGDKQPNEEAISLSPHLTLHLTLPNPILPPSLLFLSPLVPPSTTEYYSSAHSEETSMLCTELQQHYYNYSPAAEPCRTVEASQHSYQVTTNIYSLYHVYHHYNHNPHHSHFFRPIPLPTLPHNGAAIKQCTRKSLSANTCISSGKPTWAHQDVCTYIMYGPISNEVTKTIAWG